MSIDNLPVIDLELGAKLVGNDKDTAKELLSLLIKNLPDDLKLIEMLYSVKDYPKVKQHVHRLHGAVAYCGTPRLKFVLSQLDSQLKKQTKLDSLSDFMQQLASEVDLLLAEAV